MNLDQESLADQRVGNFGKFLTENKISKVFKLLNLFLNIYLKDNIGEDELNDNLFLYC